MLVFKTRLTDFEQDQRLMLRESLMLGESGKRYIIVDPFKVEGG